MLYFRLQLKYYQFRRICCSLAYMWHFFSSSFLKCSVGRKRSIYVIIGVMSLVGVSPGRIWNWCFYWLSQPYFFLPEHRCLWFFFLPLMSFIACQTNFEWWLTWASFSPTSLLLVSFSWSFVYYWFNLSDTFFRCSLFGWDKVTDAWTRIFPFASTDSECQGPDRFCFEFSGIL